MGKGIRDPQYLAHSGVHTYSRGAPLDTFPVTVKAPIITDASTQEGIRPLLDFVTSLEAHSNAQLAEVESDRLEPYFSAFSAYLGQALEKADIPDKKRKKLERLVTPHGLSGVFNALASYTRNTFISDVVIVSRGRKSPADPDFFTLHDTRTFDFYHGQRSFGFGFFQVFEGGNKYKTRSSTVVPIFMIEKEMVDTIKPHQPESVLKNLQSVLTAINHDVLHHFQSPALHEDIVRKFKLRRTFSMTEWARSIINGHLEEWSQLAHGRVFMTSGNEQLIKGVDASIEQFFNELDRIGKTLPKDKAHEVVDYFGTAMMQTLGRAFPFNHPLMDKCLDRMEKADPLPGNELIERNRAALSISVRLTKSSNATPGKIVGVNPAEDYTPTPDEIRDHFSTYDHLRETIAGYRKQGLDMLPADDGAWTFRNLKLLQLADISSVDTHAHVPQPVDQTTRFLHDDADRIALDLISTAAHIAKYNPK